MDSLFLTTGALSVVDLLSSILRVYKNVKRDSPFRDLLEELEILQNILAEAVLDLDELGSPPRLSAHLALQRCQLLAQEVSTTFAKCRRPSPLSSNIRWQMERSALETKCKDLKSAVLLLRDVVTDSLTHDLLRRVTTTAVFNNTGDAISNTVSSTPGKTSPLTANGVLRTKSTSYNPIINSPRGSVQLESYGYEEEASTNFQPAVDSRPKSAPRKHTPVENLTLFNATVSCMVDAELEQFPEHMRQKVASDCECGRRRVGFWFPVRGKWDSGADGDIVSHDVIKRAGLEALVETAEHPWTIGILGKSQVLKKTITLSWQLNNKEESFTQQFWVAEMEGGERAGFDLIIGGPWLNEHGYGVIETNESRKTTFFGLIRSLRLGGTRAQKKREKEAEDLKKRQELEKLSRNSEISLLVGRPSLSSATLPDGSASTLQNPSVSSGRPAVPQQPNQGQSPALSSTSLTGPRQTAQAPGNASSISQPDAILEASSIRQP